MGRYQLDVQVSEKAVGKAQLCICRRSVHEMCILGKLPIVHRKSLALGSAVSSVQVQMAPKRCQNNIRYIKFLKNKNRNEQSLPGQSLAGLLLHLQYLLDCLSSPHLPHGSIHVKPTLQGTPGWLSQ